MLDQDRLSMDLFGKVSTLHEIDTVFTWLTDREQYVLRKRYDTEKRTLESLRADVGSKADKNKPISRNRVRQIQCKALRKLQRPPLSGMLTGKIPATEFHAETKAIPKYPDPGWLDDIKTMFRDLSDRVGHYSDRSIDELNLFVRTANGLQNAGVRTIGDLMSVECSHLLKTKNFGRKSMYDLIDKLEDFLEIHDEKPIKPQVKVIKNTDEVIITPI